MLSVKEISVTDDDILWEFREIREVVEVVSHFMGVSSFVDCVLQVGFYSLRDLKLVTVLFERFLLKVK